MNLESKFLISHPRKIVYAILPKCASTTMHKVFLDISGIRAGSEPRKAVWGKAFAHERRRAGLESVALKSYELDRFMERYKNYFWISVVRNPYDRCISGYNNQIFRYAKKYERKAFSKTKLYKSSLKFLNINRCERHERGLKKIKNYISFYDFLEGLEQNGTGFDRHFLIQSKVINFEKINYDKIINVENLEDRLKSILVEKGDKNIIKSIPNLNTSSEYRLYKDYLRQDEIRKIYNLYSRDFVNFEYTP